MASLWTAAGKLRSKQIEVIFVITYSPFGNEKVHREQYDDSRWQKAFVETQLIAAELRKQDVAASVAPNDGQSINVHRPEVNEMSITKTVVISFRGEAQGGATGGRSEAISQTRSMGRGGSC
jgi:hypothetical protein